MKLGILGGTFDPIHLGHLRTAEEIGELLDLDRVLLIPAARPPHKNCEEVTPFSHRLRMTKIATAPSSRLEVLDLEGKRQGASYSIETLKELDAQFGAESLFYFILGEDAFLEIETWKDFRELFSYAHFVIIQRAGVDSSHLTRLISELGAVSGPQSPDLHTMPSGNRIFRLVPTCMDISSTTIREAIRLGRSTRYLVPEKVLNYIRQKGLYSYHGDPGKGQALPDHRK